MMTAPVLTFKSLLQQIMSLWFSVADLNLTRAFATIANLFVPKTGALA